MIYFSENAIHRSDQLYIYDFYSNERNQILYDTWEMEYDLIEKILRIWGRYCISQKGRVFILPMIGSN